MDSPGSWRSVPGDGGISNLSKPKMGQIYKRTGHAMMRRVEQAGWTGSGYLRGTYDGITPWVSASMRQDRFNPPSWACSPATRPGCENGIDRRGVISSAR